MYLAKSPLPTKFLNSLLLSGMTFISDNTQVTALRIPTLPSRAMPVRHCQVHVQSHHMLVSESEYRESGHELDWVFEFIKAEVWGNRGQANQSVNRGLW